MSKIKKLNMSKDFDIPNGVEVLDRATNMYKWGKDNLYPFYLNYLYYTCAVHQGIVNRKVAFILGKGLEGESQTIDMFSPILKSMILSNEVSDSYFLEFRLDYTDKSKIEKVTFIPFEWVRVNENGTSYQVSKDWTDTEEEVRTLRTYKNKTDEDQSVIFAFKTKPMQYLLGGQGRKISKSYYPEPSYTGGIKSILTDIEAVDYQYSSFRNSFAVGTIVSLNNGNITDPNDKKKIEDEIIDAGTGSENASSVLILYSNGKDTEPTVLQLSGDQLHERYTRMSQDVRDNILKAHGVISPSLFGFQSGGSFNQSEMDIAYILMKDDYFYQRQQQILEGVNFVNEVNGINEDAEFEQFNPLAEIKQSYQFHKQEEKKENKKDSEFDKMITVFKAHGIEKDETNFLFSESLNTEEPFKDVFSKISFKAIDIQVLGLIEDGNSFDKIYQSLGLKPIDLTKVYKRLADSGLIDKGILTKQGKIEIVKSDISKYEIRYTYEVKSGYGSEVIAGTRDFCRTVIGLNRMYSRDDIDSMSSALGLPPKQLWRYRGGWYHNPETNKNEPSCRHEWKQSLVYIK